MRLGSTVATSGWRMDSALGRREMDSFICFHPTWAENRKQASLDVQRPSAKVFQAEAVFLAADETLCL